MYENSLITGIRYTNYHGRAFQAKHQVLARIAKAYEQNSTIKKTHLHFASRTDWNSFEKYLRWLLAENYITHKIDGKVQQYQLTFLGRERFTIILNLHDNIGAHKPIIVQ